MSSMRVIGGMLNRGSMVKVYVPLRLARRSHLKLKIFQVADWTRAGVGLAASNIRTLVGGWPEGGRSSGPDEARLDSMRSMWSAAV